MAFGVTKVNAVKAVVFDIDQQNIETAKQTRHQPKDGIKGATAAKGIIRIETLNKMIAGASL